MMKLKKGFNSRVLSLVLIGLFLLNSAVYGIDLSNKSYLRVPVGQPHTQERMMQVMQRKTSGRLEPEDITDSWVAEQGEDNTLQKAATRLKEDHENDPEFCRLIDETPTRVWTNLPSLARHRDGEVDVDIHTLGNHVAARIAIKHELEHAKIYRHRGPPLPDDPPTQELADEIIVTYKELEYVAALPRGEHNEYLAYLRANPSINHIAYTNLLTDFLALREKLNEVNTDQERQKIVNRLTRRIHRHIRNIDRRREEPRFGDVEIRRTQDKEEVIDKIARQIFLPLAVDESPKKILLINVVDGKDKSLDFPVGLYTLKRYLENNYPEECIVEIKDVQLEDAESIIDFAGEYEPDMIGLSLMPESSERAEQFISGLSSKFPEGKRPLLALGKNTPTFAPKELLEMAEEEGYPGAICVRGEGELAIGGLLECMQGKREISDVPNAVYVEEGVVKSTPRELIPDLRVLGRVDYSAAKEYVEKGGHAWMETVRGCPWGHCTFCSTKTYWGENKWRCKPIEIIIEELKELERLGIERVTFTDEEFFGYGMGGVERARELALAIIENNIKISFYINARADALCNDDDNEEQRQFRIDTLKDLKQAGLDFVYLGLETGSPSQLKRYGKGMSISEAEGAIGVCREANVEMAIGWIMFEPLVSRKEILESIKFIGRNKILPNLSSPLNPMRVYPSIPYYRLLRNKEKELERLLISKELDLDSLTFETVGYEHPDVEIIIKLSEEYYGKEYDLYNALKWFVRFDPRIKQEEFRYIREILEEFKEGQIDLVAQLAKLSDVQLLRESTSRDVFREAVERRERLVKRLRQQIELNGHAEACVNIMKQLDIYLAAPVVHYEEMRPGLRDDILRDSPRIAAFIALLMEHGESVPAELEEKRVMAQYLEEREALSVSNGVPPIADNNDRYDKAGQPVSLRGTSIVANLEQRHPFTELLRSIIGDREALSPDGDLTPGLPSVNKWQSAILGTKVIATPASGNEHVTLYDGASTLDWEEKYEQQLNDDTKREIAQVLAEGGMTKEEAVYFVIQRRIVNALQGFTASKVPQFKPIGIGIHPAGIFMIIAPTSAEDLVVITKLQEVIRGATGITDPRTFKGRITIGYFINPIDPQDIGKFEDYLIRLDGYVKERSDSRIFELPSIQVIHFADLDHLPTVENGSFAWLDSGEGIQESVVEGYEIVVEEAMQMEEVGSGSVLGLIDTMAEQKIGVGDEITVLGMKLHRKHKKGSRIGEPYTDRIIRQEFRDAVKLGLIKETDRKDEKGRVIYEILIAPLTREQRARLPGDIRKDLDRGHKTFNDLSLERMADIRRRIVATSKFSPGIETIPSSSNMFREVVDRGLITPKQLQELIDKDDFLITSMRVSMYMEMVQKGVGKKRALEIAKGVMRSLHGEECEMMAAADLMKDGSDYAIGGKVGGTSYRFSSVKKDGSIEHEGTKKEWKQETGQEAKVLSLEEIAVSLTEGIIEAIDKNPSLSPKDAIKVGISLPGQTENAEDWGRISGYGKTCPNIPSLKDQDLSDLIEEKLRERGYGNTEVFLINDSYARLKGELSKNGTLGQSGYDSGTSVIGGTGVNASMAEYGEIVTDDGALAELGNTVVASEGFNPSEDSFINNAYKWKGRYPSDEELSRQGLQRAEVLFNGAGLAELANMFGFSIPGHPSDLPEATEAARRGDPKALEFIELYGRIVGKYLASLNLENKGYERAWANHTTLVSSIFEKFARGVGVLTQRIEKENQAASLAAEVTPALFDGRNLFDDDVLDRDRLGEMNGLIGGLAGNQIPVVLVASQAQEEQLRQAFGGARDIVYIVLDEAVLEVEVINEYEKILILYDAAFQKDGFLILAPEILDKHKPVSDDLA